MVKVGAFYALGKKKPPYTDLAPLIQKVVKAFGAKRCMWESDCPFQVAGEHTYQDSVDLVRDRLDFLSDEDKDWLLRRRRRSSSSRIGDLSLVISQRSLVSSRHRRTTGCMPLTTD